MRKWQYLFMVASVLVINGCSNESGTTGATTGGSDDETVLSKLGESCSEALKCENELTCQDGTCVKVVSNGDKCDSTHVCGTGLDCTKGVCTEVVSVGKTCDSTHLCETGLECNDGKCVDPKSGAGSKCERDSECKNSMKCHDGACFEEAQTGDSCDSSKYCVDSVCEDETCRHYGIEGEECDDEVKLCKDEMKCSVVISTCYIPGDQGAECNEDDGCASPYVCSSKLGKCIQIGILGDDCGEDLYVECSRSEGLECVQDKCRKPVENNAECSELMPCASEHAVCYEGKCLETSECKKDEECGADTYCCVEDGCDVKEVCVPYGQGPRGDKNEACAYQTVPGLFEADIQCEWVKPESGDPYPDSYNIVTPVFVSRTPHDMGGTNALIVATYKRGNVKNEAGTNIDEAYGNTPVIRIINPETCKVVENIADPDHVVSAGATMAIGDVDGDGIVEIFAQRSLYQTKIKKYGGLVAFKWSEEAKKYVVSWYQYDNLKVKNYGWGGLALHDVNDDGVPELITPSGEVYNAKTGDKLNGEQSFQQTLFPAVEDLDGDGKVEFIDYTGNVYEWTIERNDDQSIKSQSWVMEYPTVTNQTAYALKAIADFGTPGATPADFDWNNKDGIAEIVTTMGYNQSVNDKTHAKFAIHALVKSEKDGNVTKGQQRVLYIENLYGGGAPTIGDFDNDKLPEVGVALGDYYAVIDPRCKKDASGNLPEGCLAENFLWKQPNIDNSSFSTGSALFDFDGDGQIEVVYADECYTRIYDGKTGDVLFSAKHSSRTAYEMPIIADVDNDESAEIIMGANTQDRTCWTTDKIHRGIRCEVNSDCTSNVCENGFCRCSSDNECNWRKGADGVVKSEYICTDPLDADKAVNSKKVCRAQRPQAQTISGLRVMRDRFDRWASSRNLWNQFPYSINNINDDMTVPQTSQWAPNYKTPELNNYRANSLGKLGMNVAPDITCKLDKDNLCVKSQESNEIVLHGVICNRGTKMVASKMPASFYKLNEDGSLGKKYCTAYTSANVPVGGCLEVSCNIDEIEEGTRVRMVSNDDGEGGRTTVECNDQNNTDEVKFDQCKVVIN